MFPGTILRVVSQQLESRWVAVGPWNTYPMIWRNEKVSWYLLVFYENANHQDPTCRVCLNGSKLTLANNSDTDLLCILVRSPRVVFSTSQLFCYINSLSSPIVDYEILAVRICEWIWYTQHQFCYDTYYTRHEQKSQPLIPVFFCGPFYTRCSAFAAVIH